MPDIFILFVCNETATTTTVTTLITSYQLRPQNFYPHSCVWLHHHRHTHCRSGSLLSGLSRHFSSNNHKWSAWLLHRRIHLSCLPRNGNSLPYYSALLTICCRLLSHLSKDLLGTSIYALAPLTATVADNPRTTTHKASPSPRNK